mgnify:CR=1 FL=1
MGHHHHETNTTINNHTTTNETNTQNNVTDHTVVTNKTNDHFTTLNDDSAQGGYIIAHNDANQGTAVYGLQQLQTNIGHLRTRGLLNSQANQYTTTNVGHIRGGKSSVITLSELNWITDAAAKAKAAAAAAAQKVKEDAAAAKAKAAALAAAAAAKVKEGEQVVVQHVKDDIAAVKALPEHIKEQLAAELTQAKAMAAKFAQMSKAEAAQVIAAAGAMAKAEGAKLANQLIDDVEAEGHTLDADAKAKILALSIQIGQDVSDKIGDAEIGIDAVLDSKKNVFTRSIIEYIESQGQHLTVEGQEKVVALAAILGQEGVTKVDGVDALIDSLLDQHRPMALLML